MKIATVNASLRILRRVLRVAEEWGELDRAPKVITAHTAQTGSAQATGTTPALFKLQAGDGASVSLGQIIKTTDDLFKVFAFVRSKYSASADQKYKYGTPDDLK